LIKKCAKIVLNLAPYEGWKFGGLNSFLYLCNVIKEMR
jgi:hypothetical protein